MKQFFIFLFTGASIAILDLIDSAFGNHISLDSICVMSAFTVIYWCVDCICKAGEYAYRVKLKYESECFVFQVAITLICSFILITFRVPIAHIYSLTDTQYELLSMCLFYKGLCLIFGKLESFYRNYIALTCQNKHIVISNIIFYTTMIGADALVIALGGECYHLVIATGVADAITVVYYLIFCRFKWKKPTFERLKECILCAKDIVIDRVLGKVATVVFNICASNLQTEIYALHSIGYAIATSLEECTNCCYTFQIVRLKAIDNLSEKYRMCKKLSKQVFIPTILVDYMIAVLMVLPMKGVVDFKSALIITLLYNTQCILLQLYENHRGFLTSCGATECLRLGGLFGIIVRVPIAVISITTPIGIYGFALGSGIDFFIRGLYYKYKSINLINKGVVA